MGKWRWDQGRLEYFKFDNIKSISRVLVQLDGQEFKSTVDPLRVPLTLGTGLPFRAPPTHKVWRQYSRVFSCCLLATEQNNRLAITNVCRALAAEGVDVDEYLSFIIANFYFPFPAFEGYSTEEDQVFPLCAVLKYLLAAFQKPGAETSISLGDVFSLLCGNECNGTEDLAHYSDLRPTDYRPVGDEKRQVREMLIFVSQSSFLKWHKDRLYLDILPGDLESFEALKRLSEPMVRLRLEERKSEFLSIGESMRSNSPIFTATTRRTPADVLFTEGRKIRVTHLRAERSPELRRLFFASRSGPFLCHMCGMDARLVYPWTENLLEIHHLLPLCSGITITSSGTSLEDVVALCPNCHKSVHTFYKIWLNDKHTEDFASKEEAKSVYLEAKGKICVK